MNNSLFNNELYEYCKRSRKYARLSALETHGPFHQDLPVHYGVICEIRFQSAYEDSTGTTHLHPFFGYPYAIVKEPLRITKIFGPGFQAIICFVMAVGGSPVVFPVLLSTSLNTRESITLWFGSAFLFLLGVVFLLKRKDKKAIATVWLFIFSVGISAALLEGGLRLAIKPEESLLIYTAAPDTPNAFRLKPNLNFTTRVAKMPVSVITSSEGLRDTTEFRDAGPEKIRIAFVGDSFTFGLWADSAEKSFPHRVGEILDLNLYSIYNLGVPGYGIEDSLHQLKRHWDAIRPHIVVLSVYNGNDFLDSYLGMGRFSVTPDGLLEFNNSITTSKIPAAWRTPEFQLEPWLKEHFYTAKVLARVLSLLTHASHASLDPPPNALPENPAYSSNVFWSLKEYPGFAEEARRVTLKHLEDFARFCRQEKQVQLLIVTVPYQEQVVIPERFGPQYLVSRPQSFIYEFSREHEIPYLDLQPPLSRAYLENGHPLYYYFDGHFNNFGHDITAVEIARAIRTQLQNR